MSSPSFGDLLSEYEQSHSQRRDSAQLEATVIAISGDTIFLDVGLKTEGVIPLAEFRSAAPRPGDKALVSIRGREPEGYYRLSLIRVERPKDWAALERAMADKTPVAGTVTSVIKGGLSVDIGIRAFLPASRSGARDAAEIEKLVGQEIRCLILSVDSAKEDVVVDRRALLEQEEERARERRYSELQPGDVVRGTVRSLTDFGVFVDLGGVDGLLHVTDMSWGRVSSPADLLSVGDSIEVQVLKLDAARRRISLGMKQLQPIPWDGAAERYPVGARVRGTVARVVDFGAFIELEPGIEGLMHVSDMSWSKKARCAGDVVKPSDAVEVVVLSVNSTERRVALGLKQALGDPWDSIEARFPVGSAVEGPVTSLTGFGAFVQLADGVEGMIHVGDISAGKRIHHPQDVLKSGQSVRAAVLEIDRQKRRLRLGIKQLQPTSIDEYIAEHKEGDLVSGRLAEVAHGRARVELGEGIRGFCKISDAPEGVSQPEISQPDLTSLSSMLAAKWKGGALAPKREAARAGQVRSFRIVRLDPAEKAIELELAG
ncbi:MAG: 30S ribosomal protein S1 [Acidobacteria bacterium]|nr:30S ribosomal protein S1 [Acidobacteriota bacterium]